MGVRHGSRKPARQECRPTQVNGDLLRRAVDWIVADDIFSNVTRHGNTTWCPKLLVVLAVFTAWMDAKQLTKAFEKAATLSQELFNAVAFATFQGLVRALDRYSPQLLPILWARIQSLMELVAPRHFRIGKWLPLAADGSRCTTPRTRGNEQAFSAKNYGQGKLAKSRKKWKNKKRRSKKLGEPVKPQIWLTLIWHMGLKLPWCWKTGPSTSSERHHFMDQLKSLIFQKNTLFCADAGFVGYELWSTILDSGASFLIRVGANVRLLKDIGDFRLGDGIVLLWPKDARRKKLPPLVLRLLEVRGEHGSMYLVTNVLSEKELSNAMIKRLYPLRWGIELQFRALKQTFGRGKLRSRNPDYAIVELEWSLVALAMIQLIAIKEQIVLDIPPEKTSVARAISAVRHAIDTWNIPTSRRRDSFQVQIRTAVKDDYQRQSSKKARYHANYKDKPHATKPIVTKATSAEKEEYRMLNRAA